ncbi:retrotransposon protein, putative, ty1-copia subclass [Tanacetum coccineum]
MLSNQKPSGDKLGLGFNSFEASSSGTKEIKFVKAQKKAFSDGGPINMVGPQSEQAAPKIIMRPPPATPGSEKSVSFQKSILGPRPKHIIVNNVKVPVASDNVVKQFSKPLSKPGVGFSKPNFRSKTPPPRRVNTNYPRAKTPQPKRNVGRQNQPRGFPICLGVDLEPDEWIKDSGCSRHMTGNQKLFSTYKAYNGGNVIFGSNLRGNIIGKGQICDNKCRVTFSEHDSEITKDGKVIGRGIRKKGLYVMKLGNKPKDKICLATIDENSTLWHRRLGHANMRLIQSLASKELQASRSWNKRFDEEIKRFGFAQNLDEPCVYQKASGSNVTFLILYVDDIIIMGNHIPSLQSVKDYLGKCFAMKDLGEAAFILGIKIYRDRSKRLIGLSQNAYMDTILKRYKMDNSKRGHIPMQERLDLNKSQGAQTPKEVNRMKNVPYASAVGSIMYAVRCTRPDVAFAQNLTSRFQQNPGELHWTAVKNILKYLRNTKDMFLVYGGNPEAELRVDCYCNAGFETDIDDMKSLTEYLNYIAASEAEMEAVWIRKFISGLGIVPTINELIKMFCDDSAALLIALLIANNLSYPFTKALPKGKLTQHARSMGLRLASSFM